METIKHAAVIAINGWVVMGKSHADCFHKAHHIKLKMSKKAEDQGFITSEGRYVSRHEAARIAWAADQLHEPHSILFSENLWSAEDDGKYNYNENEGYVLRNHPAK